MPVYKLYYFAMRGTGEVIRQLLSLAEVEFEDIRITHEQWPEFKPKTPFGHVPVLEVDGKQIPESFAIARYIAKQHGLAGATPFEAAWVDALADQYRDFQNEFKKYSFMQAGVVKGDLEEAKRVHGIPACNAFFPLIVKQLKETGSGFLVGSSATWVDILISAGIEKIQKSDSCFLAEFPEVIKFQERVHALPQIKKWIESRP